MFFRSCKQFHEIAHHRPLLTLNQTQLRSPDSRLLIQQVLRPRAADREGGLTAGDTA